jgi:hypothetical protein
MSRAEVRRDYGRPWRTDIGAVAEILDAGRARLETHHFEMVRPRLAGTLTDDAESAEQHIQTALSRRTRDFRQGSAPRVGPAWDALYESFLGACAEVSAVSRKLSLAIDSLLDDNRNMPPIGVLDTARLTPEQGASLRSSQTRLRSRTARYLARAQFVFVSGRQGRSGASSSRVSSAGS